MDDAERFEILLERIEELRARNEEEPIVVEGLRDIASLRSLGMEGHIIPINSGVPLFQVAEAISQQADAIILLTDWDAKGQTLFEALRTALLANGVKVDGEVRVELRHAIRPTIPDVESLASYVQRGLERFHGKDLADHFGS